MEKFRYFKFMAENGEYRLMRYSNNKTEGYVSNRWMYEPSLITKINGTAPNEDVVEITEEEARKIAGVESPSIFSNLLTGGILIMILVACVAAFFFVYKIISKDQKNKEAEKKTTDERILEVLSIGENEEDITKSYTKDEIEKMYNLIPFSGSSGKHAYQKDNTNISVIDSVNLYSMAVMHCNMGDVSCSNGISSLEGYKVTYNISTLKSVVANLYNGYDGYNILSLPNEFISSDNKTYCLLSSDREYYDCKDNDTLLKSYRLYKIVKVTSDEDNLYLYESSVFVKNEYKHEDKYFYNVYRYSNGKEQIAVCNDDTNCTEINNTYDKYAASSVIYKHTFKKNGNNSYYWYSTEFNGKL